MNNTEAGALPGKRLVNVRSCQTYTLEQGYFFENAQGRAAYIRIAEEQFLSIGDFLCCMTSGRAFQVNQEIESGAYVLVGVTRHQEKCAEFGLAS